MNETNLALMQEKESTTLQIRCAYNNCLLSLAFNPDRYGLPSVGSLKILRDLRSNKQTNMVRAGREPSKGRSRSLFTRKSVYLINQGELYEWWKSAVPTPSSIRTHRTQTR